MTRFRALFVSAAVLLGVAHSAPAELVDGVVATVGAEVILHSELIQSIAPVLQQLQKQGADNATFNQQAQDQLRQALDQAIDEKILLREALLAGLEIDDKDVESRIDQIKKRFASNEEFEKELKAAGETVSEFRDRVRKHILAMSMALRKHRQFEQAAEISEAEMAEYYAEHKDKFSHPERVSLRRIFLQAASGTPERAQAKARMQELKKQIDAGADFAELAKANSAGPEAPQGGLVGWVSPGDFVKELSDAAFALPEGGVSDVIETEFGVVLLKAEKKEAAGTMTLDEARKVIEPELRTKSAEEKYKKWITELRKRSRVRIFLS
jgi:parvulin-like peptidyl-prolyl isomerase